jgi:2-polyprenyl-6-methoxyphenol hydroxylase-like FAD-dependent oxidoreductase
MNKFYDVIVGGAGPVGLFLACELGLAGVSVLVLEKDSTVDPLWTAKPIGMRGLNTLSIESLYRRGLMEKVVDPIDERPDHLVKSPVRQFAGHFAGMMVDANKFDLSRWKYRLPGPSLLPARTDLDRIGAALSERAENVGVTIMRGNAVKKFTQDSDGVTVYAGDEGFRAKYLVGCDGGRSTIRKEGGFEFIGTEPQFTGYTALCELDDHQKLKPFFQPTPFGMYIHLTSTNLTDDFGHVIVMDFDGGKFDRTTTVKREHFQDILRRVSGTDVIVKDLRFISTFTDRALQAKTYRKDRVLLAGDSAHIHSPLGGQGLNAGIGDAMNLGWKLASVVKGKAPASLLDTYCEEREPIGAWVVEWTRAQVTVLKPDLFGQATAKIVRDLIDTADGANYFIDRVWGLWQRYDLGDGHSLVGASAPDFEFVDGTRLGNEMRDGKGLLIDFSNNPVLAELSSAWDEKLEYVNFQVKDNLGLDALLVRPDGIVAWVSEGKPDLNTAKAALTKWFGPVDSSLKNKDERQVYAQS